MNIIQISDLPSDTPGKSWKEKNMEIQHLYAVDDLVEIEGWDEDCEFTGMRMYIIGCTRDCDGTPLYVLGTKGLELYDTRYKSGAMYNPKSHSGFSERSIKLIKKTI